MKSTNDPVNNVQCSICTGWPHRDKNGIIALPFTCVNYNYCVDIALDIEDGLMRMEEWNAPIEED